jgi:hypothetical protein
MLYFKIISQHYLEVTEESHTISQPRYPFPSQDSNSGPYEYETRVLTTKPECLTLRNQVSHEVYRTQSEPPSTGGVITVVIKFSRVLWRCNTGVSET